MARSDWGIGLVGLGGIARHHLLNYRAHNLNIIGGADIDPVRRDERQREFGLPFVVDDYHSLITHPDVKIVDINVPHFMEVRQPIVELCAQHGKAMFIQKPLMPNLADARTLIEIAERGNAPVMVNQNSLFVPGFQVIEPYLRDPQYIGKPYYFQIENRAWADVSTHPWFGKHPRWITSDMAIHHFALIRHWFGDAESVYALMQHDPSQTGVVGENLSVLSIRFKNGVQGLVINNWAYHGPHRRGHPAEDIVIQGDRGSISGTSKEIVVDVRTPIPARIHPEIKAAWFDEAFGNAMAHFIDGLDTGKAWLCEGRDNLKTVAIAEAAYLSVEQRREVRLDELV